MGLELLAGPLEKLGLSSSTPVTVSPLQKGILNSDLLRLGSGQLVRDKKG